MITRFWRFRRNPVPCRILVVDEMVPDRQLGAGFPRSYEIVRVLVDVGYRVDMLPMMDPPQDRRERVEALFGGSVAFHYERDRRGVRRLLRKRAKAFSVVFVSRPTTMSKLVSDGWLPRGKALIPPLIYDAEAVFAERDRLRRTVHPPAFTDAEYQNALADELDLVRRADLITTVGPADADVLRSQCDTTTVVLGHSKVARRDPPGVDGRRDFLFVGSLHGDGTESPNVDSVIYFIRDIMPAIDRVIGADYRLHIVGHVTSPQLASLASERVILHGVVEDLRPFYDRCRVFVAATRYAAGIPLKVVDAMGEGIPCVVTRLLARQLDADDSIVRAADTAEGFAAACARLYTDSDAWRSTRDAASEHVDRLFSPSVFRRQLLEALDAVTARDGSRRS